LVLLLLNLFVDGLVLLDSFISLLAASPIIAAELLTIQVQQLGDDRRWKNVLVYIVYTATRALFGTTVLVGCSMYVVLPVMVIGQYSRKDGFMACVVCSSSALCIWARAVTKGYTRWDGCLVATAAKRSSFFHRGVALHMATVDRLGYRLCGGSATAETALVFYPFGFLPWTGPDRGNSHSYRTGLHPVLSPQCAAALAVQREPRRQVHEQVAVHGRKISGRPVRMRRAGRCLFVCLCCARAVFLVPY
jgi:hypothetical protein